MKKIGFLLLYCLFLSSLVFGQNTDFDKAVLHAKNGEYEKAISYFLKEYDESCRLKDSTKIMFSARMLGNVFTLMKDSTNRNKYYRLSINLSRKLGDEESLFYSLCSTSQMYVYDRMPEKALRACEEALQIVQSTDNTTIKNDTSSIGNILINSGAANEQLNNQEKALEYYLLAASYFEKYPYTLDQMGQLYRNIGMCYEKANRKEESLEYYEKALDISLEKGFKNSIQYSVHGLYRWHKKFGDPEVALEYLEKSVELKDSLLNKSTISSVQELHSKYQSDKLQEQINDLSISNKESNKKIKSSRAWIIWLIIISLAIAGIAVLLILRQRFVLKTQELEFDKKRAELQKRVLTAQMNPHFLFNSLNSIQRMYLEGNLNEANNFMANFSSLLRKVLAYSNLELVKLSEDIELLKIYLELERNRVDTDFQFQINMTPDVDASFMKVPPLLVQPFIENAIWHGIVPLKKPGEINILYSVEKDYLICIITDNGIGYEKSQAKRKKSHVSKGISIVRERLSHLPDPISICQLGESGTQVTIKIPFT
ncbi:MAG: histidine kinase [Flavobacteriales bacterium]|nr:histidine kinase [Flavobacteriales bacterium]